MKIRTVTYGDYKEINEIIKTSFEKSPYGYNGEILLVENIRKLASYKDQLELVAQVNDEIVGHLLLSEAKIGNSVGLVLAPVSVKISFQKQGIAASLIKEAEKRAENFSYDFITILGDANYYGRFGYERASNYNVQCSLDVPSDYFLIKKLNDNKILSGILQYNEAFL